MIGWEAIAGIVVALLGLVFGGTRMALNRKDRRDAAKLDHAKNKIERLETQLELELGPLASDADHGGTLERMLDDAK